MTPSTVAWLADHQTKWRNTTAGNDLDESLPAAWVKTPFGKPLLILSASRTYIAGDWVHIFTQEWPSLRETLHTVKPSCEIVLSTTIKHGDEW